MPERPIILTVFSNVEEPHILTRLKDERREVFQIVNDRRVNKFFEHMDLPVQGAQDLLKYIQDYRDRIAVFHYAGHAEKAQALLEEEKVFMKGVAEMFRSEEHKKSALKLVVLNGCATFDMTEPFFEAGAKAVIATNARIQDVAAKHFAVSFYSKLLKHKGTLQDAFRDGRSAVHSVSDQIPVKDLAVLRGPDIRQKLEQLKTAHPRLPWLLQISDIKMLTASFFPSRTSMMLAEQANAARNEAYIAAKQKQIDEKTAELTQLTAKLERKERILAVLLENDPDLAQEQQKEIDTLKLSIRQLKDEVEILEKEKLAEDPQRKSDLVNLEKAFDKIDYYDQLFYFKNNYSLKAFQAYILQGCEESSMELLVDLILFDIEIHFKSQNVFVDIDFSIKGNEAPTKANIWNKVKSSLKIPTDKSQKETTHAILDYLKTQHVFFHFKRMNSNKPALNFEILYLFWSEFLEQVRLWAPESNFDHKCFLIASDENCPFQETEPYVLDRAYEKAVKDQLLAEQPGLATDPLQMKAAYEAFLSKYNLHIVQSVQPIIIEQLQRWIVEYVPLNYRLFQADQQKQLLDHNGKCGFVLSTIRNYCDQFEEVEKDIYIDKFAKYEINPNN